MPRPDLRALPPALRVLCAGFLISLGLAYAVALLFVFVQSGMKPKGISEQFRGGSGEPAAGEAPAGDGASAQAEDPDAGAGEDLPSLGREWKSRDQGMKFPKPLKEMILTTHLHMLSISGILLLVGAIFACSSFPEKAKPWIIAAGFAGLALDYACMWGVRYASEAFSAGVFAFGFTQSLSLAVQMLAGLKDLLFPAPTGTSTRSPD
ncbi:MAG TPA: hypothetical protein VJ385_02165 [Fibrobacteria bacterium]|nr:hypothetical protein [Fibrobacteria bacterium]